MITFAEIDDMLRSAQPMLAATLYPAAGLLAVVFGFELHRLGDEDVHDVDDYKPAPAPAAPVRQRRRLRRPVETPIHNRLVAEQVVAELMRERYGTTDRAAIAGGFLRDIAAVQQAKAGIRPRSTHWRSDSGECWIGCPICDRDMTGAFPVVRAA